MLLTIRAGLLLSVDSIELGVGAQNLICQFLNLLRTYHIQYTTSSLSPPLSIMPWCEDCNQHFSTSSRLQRHLDTSAAHQTPEYVCEPCNRVFNTEEGLTKHEKNSVKHLHNKYNYVCEDCHWGCNKEKTMDEHDTEFHFWCKEHDRFFADENELRQVGLRSVGERAP